MKYQTDYVRFELQKRDELPAERLALKKHSGRRPQNAAAVITKSFHSVVALSLVLAIQLGCLPHSVKAQTRPSRDSVPNSQQVARAIGLLHDAKILTKDKTLHAKVEEAETLLAGRGIAHKDGAADAGTDQFSPQDFSRAHDIMQLIIYQPSSESNDDFQQRISEALRLLDEAFSPTFGGGVRATTEIAFGLQTTTFNTLQGTVAVNLPADLAPGDIISGTVIAEAKGKTEAERANNQAELSGYVVQIDKEEVSTDKQVAKLQVPTAQPMLPVSLKTKDGKEIARASVPVQKTFAKPSYEWAEGAWYQPNTLGMGKPVSANTSQPTGKRGTEQPSWPGPITMSNYQWPSITQAGKPLLVKGKFDGDLTTSAVNIRNLPTRVLAESPRGVIAICPADAGGKAEISVWENQKVLAKGVFTSLAIRLSAEKLNLLRGEQTTMTVTVQGVEGLEAPATVRLTNTSPWSVRMGGGETQTFTVTPSNSKAAAVTFGGSLFTTTRTLTGVQPGGFSIVAVLVTEVNAS